MHSYIKGIICESCVANDLCEWVDPSYYKMFGEDGFIQIIYK